ncbi:chaperone protein dnaJ C76, chloroplastic-like [Malania oleifera]|uniref:chaperone protein dnaJ C76, chloroplastic-like n=1 Tax=Malania oleifera TaxID=397392 RepID=UPI0025AE6FA9|nr:chaperone protein dnaJ C76, chloroplastic-like [Malania oleifera]
MPIAGLPLYTPTAPVVPKSSNPRSPCTGFSAAAARRLHDRYYSATCRAFSSSSSSINTVGFDLYDLLGIDSCSDQVHIKAAYRSLQKRCHPDVAGPAGHDMAIILNEVYSILSNPNSRLAYDKEQAKMTELRGYTGKPIYSAWFGAESEERAVFVDEVKCVGCLKCALFAEKTFAIEATYGRARVVAQWADPEDKVQEAMDACPVDCISIVERSDLAALEFLMSKQPRGNVRVGANNAAGTGISNIYVHAKKFQNRFQDTMDKASRKQFAWDTDPQREARMSAVQAIRSISRWLYWQSPNISTGGVTTDQTCRGLQHIQRKSHVPNVEKLREAAANRKQVREKANKLTSRTPSGDICRDEYWTPPVLSLPVTVGNSSGSSSSATKSSPSTKHKEASIYEAYMVSEKNPVSPLVWGLAMGMATIATGIARLQVGEGAVEGLKEHVGGSLALEIVNSSWLQVILAGVPWYLIAVVMVEIITKALWRRDV